MLEPRWQKGVAAFSHYPSDTTIAERRVVGSDGRDYPQAHLDPREPS
jgi:hypothetical protein